MCRYKSLLIQSYSQFSEMERRTRQECAATSPYCLSPVVSTKKQREELDRNIQLQVLIASALQSVLTDREKNQIRMCSYKSLLIQSYSQFSQTERRTRQECAATSPYCLSPAISTRRHREELDRNVQLRVLIDTALQSVLTDGELNQMGMCNYKSLFPHLCSHYSQTERRTRQECAATSPYCLSPAFGNQHQREDLDRNVQLQVLIDSVLQSVFTDGEKNQIGWCSYKSLLIKTYSQFSQMERRTRQECATTSPYCLSPAVITQRQREELDRNVQLQFFIDTALQSVLTDGEQNQIGMCNYKSLLPQSCSHYSETGRRTRQECADKSPYCLNPAVGTHRQREELDKNVQLQVLIDSALQSVLTDGEKNQIGMCSYKSLLPQTCSQYSETERRTRQECAATSPYCLSPVVSNKKQREELDRNIQLQVLIASVLQSVLTDGEKNQIGMCSYKSLLPQSCSWYSQIQRRTRQECAATSPYCLSPTVGTHRRRVELGRNVQLQVFIASVLQSLLRDRDKNQIGMCR